MAEAELRRELARFRLLRIPFIAVLGLM